jgi:hypothetical protein
VGVIGCGRADPARKNAFVALLLACALGVQILLAGMALAGAAGPSGEAAFSQSCATATSSPTTGQDPLAPGGHGHEHGLCCILHTGLAGPGAPEGVDDRLTPPRDVKLPASRENRVAARAPPELEPLAPRGPPTFQI